jgi:hypothetical protein
MLNNSKEFARLFKKRTGVTYENWIQGMSVTARQNKRNLVLSLIPKWIAIIILVTAVFWHLSCAADFDQLATIDGGYIIDSRNIDHRYKSFPFLYHGDRTTVYCKKHFKWEAVTAQFNSEKDGYNYIVIKHRRER